jgi:metal-responsive CopG/Arc/MetJ family transcriptional regulator
MKKQHLIPVTIKADMSLFNQINEVCKTPNSPTRADFMRDALTSYLNYYNTVLLPTLTQQKTASEFYQDEGIRKYSDA